MSATDLANLAANTPPEGCPRWHRCVLWIGLAFCPSALLLAVTSHMTQNIAPVPLLWMLPLALYLLSFILSFEGERWYRRGIAFLAFIFATAVMLSRLFQTRSANLRFEIPLFTIGFFLCALICHGELYQLRPSPRWLTWFYLSISFGGALGGVFAGLIAPLVFKDYTELPVALLLTVLLVGSVLYQSPPFLAGSYGGPLEFALLATLASGFLFLLTCVSTDGPAHCLLMRRNFYGAVRIYDYPETNETEPMRELVHGNVNHGSEFMRAAFHRWPTTYYGPTSGVGIALGDRPGIRSVAVVGLGTGAISAYARAGDRYRFYEINPTVLDIAKSYFFYLKECPAQWDVVLAARGETDCFHAAAKIA
jgi:hypothetical protein